MTTTVHIKAGQPAHDDVLVTTLDAAGKPFGPPQRLTEGQEVTLCVHAHQRLLIEEVHKR